MKNKKIKSARAFALVFVSLFPAFAQVCVCEAVTSRIFRHSSSHDFVKGEPNNVVIGSRGTVRLGTRAEPLVKEVDDVWSINSIVTIGDTIYIGTSPNGGVYAFSMGQLKEIYTAEPQHPDTEEPNDPNVVDTTQHLANEHIFAMQEDISGRLLVGISGRKCALYRLEKDKMKLLYEPDDANYIFAITVDKAGNIYLATGPKGKIYRLDSRGKKTELIADTPDKNILSLTAGPDGFIYAGSDTRGLVYKIDPRTGQTNVLYDSDQQEITAVLFSEGQLYAAATSAQVVNAEARFSMQAAPAGRPEQQSEEQEPPEGENDAGSRKSGTGGLKLQIANTKEEPGKKPVQRKVILVRRRRPVQASFLYRITDEGFVTDIFSESAVFFCLAQNRGKLLLGTGNDAQLFQVDPNSEEQAIIYEDRQASQITAVSVRGDDTYIGTANPAKLVKLDNAFAGEGTYLSDLVDADQPAKWGKLQIEADIPPGCSVLAACRSGNVKDVNDPSFSEWSALKEVTGPIQLDCPIGRFCQYKLVLRGEEKATPEVREVALAATVPNLAPQVKSVNVAHDKDGAFKISYNVKDDNNDKLIYKIDFRKADRTEWIEIKDDVDTATFEWDGRTVEDGRYEIRVTANDQRSNTPETKLTGSRVSDVFVVDNTGPVIENHTISTDGTTATLKMTVSDELSVIGKVDYTIDSNADWKGAIPDDFVYDTTSEDFTIAAEDLNPGRHVIALRLADDLDNTTYKSFEFDIE